MGDGTTTQQLAAEGERAAAPTRQRRASATAARRAEDGQTPAFWRIGEVAEKLGVPTHVIRFWQTQFPALQPARTGSGRFIYTAAQVDQLLRIRQLLHVERMTFEGAKRALRSGKARVLLATTAAAAAELVAAAAGEVAAADGEVAAAELEILTASTQAQALIVVAASAAPAVDRALLTSLTASAQALRRRLEAMRVQIEEA